MTIAAGFFYKGGLLLCADTQATSTFKISASKILPHEFDDGTKTVFVTVGHISYARMGAQLAEMAIQQLPTQGRTLDAIYETLIEQIYSLYVKHLYVHPSWNHDPGLRVQFLVGVWSAVDQKIGFFKNEDTAVEQLYGYECLGSGAELAHYLIRPQYQRRPSKNAPHAHDLAEVQKIGFAALEQVKSHDPNCGGDTQWMTLSDGGERQAGAKQSPSRSRLTGSQVLRRTKHGR